MRKQDALEDDHYDWMDYGWLERTVEGCTGRLKANLPPQFRQLKNLDEVMAAYSEEVDSTWDCPAG